MNKDITGIFIAVLTLSSLAILIAFVFFVLKDKDYWHFDFRTRSSSKVLTIIAVVCAILSIAIGIVYYVNIDKEDKFLKTYQTYLDKKCFDKYQNSVIKALDKIIKYLHEQHGDLANLAKGAFYASIAFIVADVIVLALKQKSGTTLFEGPFTHD